jgi:site-specific DNA-methyltransferase (adenine-specific)
MFRYSVLTERDKIHTTQKPVALYTWLLQNYDKRGDKILDTHVGSASSLIACHRMGFEYWGFELDPDYYKAASERMTREMDMKPLFEPQEMYEQLKIGGVDEASAD